MGEVLLRKLSEVDFNEIRALMNREVYLEEVIGVVKEIVNEVKRRGDLALVKFAERFDGVKLRVDELKVSHEEFEEAKEMVPDELIEALNEVYKRVSAFQRTLIPHDIVWKCENTKISVTWIPLRRIGVYIPGGRAAYPSTAIMNIAPAKIAGVNEIVVCTPPLRNSRKVNPVVLVALEILGVRDVFKVGGAQAIAALAYGTESIPRVDKIVGPGNIYVTAAKYLVSKDVGVDMLAGPTELIILAGEEAEAEWIVYDLAAQAEHDSQAQAILITFSEKLARKVFDQCLQLKNEVAGKIAILVTKDLDEALKFIEEYSPEHLMIIGVDLKDIHPAYWSSGTVFIGEYTAPAMGDYILGANHVLPTARSARWRGELSVYDFLKPVVLQEASKEVYEHLGIYAKTIAEAEGLKWHAQSIKARKSSLRR